MSGPPPVDPIQGQYDANGFEITDVHPDGSYDAVTPQGQRVTIGQHGQAVPPGGPAS